MGKTRDGISPGNEHLILGKKLKTILNKVKF